MTYFIAPIVEGHTEVSCVERLLHRIWSEFLYSPDRLQVLRPIRCKRNLIVDTDRDELAGKLNQAAIMIGAKSKDSADRKLVLVLCHTSNDG